MCSEVVLVWHLHFGDEMKEEGSKDKDDAPDFAQPLSLPIAAFSVSLGKAFMPE